jgi:hypothetical protein
VDDTGRWISCPVKYLLSWLMPFRPMLSNLQLREWRCSGLNYSSDTVRPRAILANCSKSSLIISECRMTKGWHKTFHEIGL